MTLTATAKVRSQSSVKIMAKIPQHVIAQSRSSGADISDGVFNQTSRALGQLMGAVNNVPAEIKRELDQAQNMRNQSDINDRLRGMREMQAEHLQQLTRDRTDPSEWATTWKSKLTSYENSLGEKGVPPAVIRAVKEKFKSFAGTSMLSITGAALKENRKNSVRSLESGYNEFIRSRQYDKADELVEQAHRNKVIDDIDAKEYHRGISRKREDDSRQIQLLEDPSSYKKKLEAGELEGISEVKRLKEIEKADREISSQESESITLIRELQSADIIDSKEELIREIDNMGNISETSKKAIIANFESNQEIPGDEQTAFTDRVHDLYTAYTDGSITFEKYEEGFFRLLSEANAYGSRDGVGRLTNFLRARDPLRLKAEEENQRQQGEEEALKQDEAIQKEAMRKRASELTDVDNTISQMVRQRVGADSKINTAEKSFIPGADDVQKARFEKQQGEKGLIIRQVMEKKMSAWAASLPTAPNEIEIKKHMDEIQAETVEEVSQGRFNIAPEQSPSAAAAEEWLGTANGTMLPSIDNGETDFGVPKSPADTEGELPPFNPKR